MEKDLKQLIAEMDAIEQNTDEALRIGFRGVKPGSEEEKEKWKKHNEYKASVKTAFNSIQDENVKKILQLLANKVGVDL